jgi:hypothetical protein
MRQLVLAISTTCRVCSLRSVTHGRVLLRTSADTYARGSSNNRWPHRQQRSSSTGGALSTAGGVAFGFDDVGGRADFGVVATEHRLWHASEVKREVKRVIKHEITTTVGGVLRQSTSVELVEFSLR